MDSLCLESDVRGQELVDSPGLLSVLENLHDLVWDQPTLLRDNIDGFRPGVWWLTVLPWRPCGDRDTRGADTPPSPPPGRPCHLKQNTPAVSTFLIIATTLFQPPRQPGVH